jgi:hypothetical protein
MYSGFFFCWGRVIASEAKQSRKERNGLPRRYAAPGDGWGNDGCGFATPLRHCERSEAIRKKQPRHCERSEAIQELQ